MVTKQVPIGSFGVFGGLSFFEDGRAATVERLGYTAIWIPAVFDSSLQAIEAILEQTTHIAVGSAVVNIWTAPASEVAQSFWRLENRFPGRFLLSVGAGHREHLGDHPQTPYRGVAAYLDTLTTAGVPKDRLALGALRIRMLSLAKSHTSGANPYLTTPEHTRFARSILGDGALLAPERKVVFDTNPVTARNTARQTLTFYLQMSNYVRTLNEFGYPNLAPGDTANDALVDALVSHGTPAQIARGLRDHLDAGADHVAVQPLHPEFDMGAINPATIEANQGRIPELAAIAPALIPGLTELATELGLTPR
ncbi:TIGR03620 family F420-dependent LLM class oxidoreductase [Mycobacteroides abscessus subsp. massiliense]|uniref:TIGR03620 family F420-dependent LLM class oxidoreductase n=1 Tax=Mycobacteroides abscessus TaxID=36809 RepID=UPI00266B48F9|nr:TIGR03620 family F420-dependent LLM class oxidoreductase [Mycobacteroides abscessus]MDO3299172.1 TIGR03620 family F420-dependent LLM class oxidoreductase [Mycobacteroides abscessus subsp. massiliense]